MKVGEVINALIEAANRCDMSDRALSIEVFGNPEGIRALRKGHRPRIDRMIALAERLGFEVTVAPLDIMASVNMPRQDNQETIHGEVLANGTGEGLDGTVRLNMGEERSADILQSVCRKDCQLVLAVRGKSLDPQFRDGDEIWLNAGDVLCDQPRRLVGREGVMIIESGGGGKETVLRRLRRGDSADPNLWNLESFNPCESTLTNRRIISILPVRLIRRAP